MTNQVLAAPYAQLSIDPLTQVLTCNPSAQLLLGDIDRTVIHEAVLELIQQTEHSSPNRLLMIHNHPPMPVHVIQAGGNFHILLLQQDLLEFAFGNAYPTRNQAVAIIQRNGEIIARNAAFNALFHLEHQASVPSLNASSLEEFDYLPLISQAVAGEAHKTLTIAQIPHVVCAFSLEPDQRFWALSIEPMSQACGNLEALQSAKLQAEQASEAKGRFLATMSHEIRSPLNAIINMAKLLLNTSLNTQQKQYANVAYSGGQTLLALINDILDFSKIEAGHLELNEDAFDLIATLEDLTQLFCTRAQESHIELCLTINPDVSGHYLGDRQRIRQILINLISNAIKFTDKGGVVIALEEAPDHEGVIISVSDTGIGMTPDEVNSVFQAFVQAQSSEHKQYGGTGLGLAIVKQLTDLMDGEISVTSTQGSGSVFRLLLPLQKVLSHQDAINLLPKSEHSHQWLAVIDSPNQTLCKALTVQNGYYGIRTFHLQDIDEPINGQYEQVFIFGEADEGRQNIEHYHTFADTYLHTNVVHFIALSNLNFSDALKQQLLRGFSKVFDRPLLPSTLRQYYFDAPTTHLEPQSQSPQTHATILLVDDGETNRAVASALLEQIGVDCDISVNGTDALDKVAHKRYPLILMDLAMPIMDGLEATSRIRSGTSINKETPIVALTANAFAEDRAACLAAGMNDYLSKPINSDIFFQKVRYWLHQEPIPQKVAVDNPAPPSPVVATPSRSNDDNNAVLDTAVLEQLIKDTSTQSLKVILEIYCKEVEERIPNMELLLSQEIWSTLADEAHILKSSSASFGAVELSVRAKAIELGVRANNFDQVRSAMQNIAPLAESTLAAQKQFLAKAIHS